MKMLEQSADFNKVQKSLCGPQKLTFFDRFSSKQQFAISYTAIVFAIYLISSLFVKINFEKLVVKVRPTPFKLWQEKICQLKKFRWCPSPDFQVVFFKDVISLEVYIPRIPEIQKGKYEPVRNMCQLFFSFTKLAYFTRGYLFLRQRHANQCF